MYLVRKLEKMRSIENAISIISILFWNLEQYLPYQYCYEHMQNRLRSQSVIPPGAPRLYTRTLEKNAQMEKNVVKNAQTLRKLRKMRAQISFNIYTLHLERLRTHNSETRDVPVERCLTSQTRYLLAFSLGKTRFSNCQIYPEQANSEQTVVLKHFENPDV